MMPTAPVKVEHDDFPIACSVFVAKLKGTPDEIWSKVLANRYGQRKFVYSEWRAALANIKAGK